MSTMYTPSVLTILEFSRPDLIDNLILEIGWKS